MRRPGRPIRLLTGWFLTAIAIQAILSIFVLNAERAFPNQARLVVPAAVAAASLIVMAVWRHREMLVRRIHVLSGILSRPSRRSWLCSVIGVGLCIRVAWVLAFPVAPHSDAASYVALAGKLMEGQPYSAVAGWSYWPPGYPFLLAGVFTIFGRHPWTPVLLNLLIFVATVPLVYNLTHAVADAVAARLSTLVLALCPGHVTCSGIAAKEMPLVAVILLALLCYLLATRQRSAARALPLAFAAGLAQGFAALIQPSLLGLTAVFLLYDLALGSPLLKLAARALPLLVGVSLALLPWTLRNHRVLHTFVLVSTNGGSNFYRANNPRATGGFVSQGEVDLDQFDELTANRLGYELGIRWIIQNPSRFLALCWRKQTLFLGDDGAGAYETLKRGLDISSRTYGLSKAISNAYWLLLWILVLVYSVCVRNQCSDLLLITGPLFYLYTMHSIFESSGRYHLPVIGVLAILAGLIATDSAQRYYGEGREARRGIYGNQL